MKTQFFILSLLLFSGVLAAQDTIFVRTGQVIPAIIVEKNSAEIKYRKFGPPPSPAIYSVFISDVASIHYKDGIIADYTAPAESATENRPKTAFEMAGTMRAIRISVGTAFTSFNRDKVDNLQEFWKNRTGTTEMSENPVCFPVDIKMTFIMGNSGRNWVGDEVQLISTPKNSIYASKFNNEIELNPFIFNIVLYYGHTINHKKTIAAILEPGADFAFMSGHIKLNNGGVVTNYLVSQNFGVGPHVALGLDWVIAKRLLASARIGQRFMTIKESHKNEGSSTGYSTFYIHPGLNQDLLSVKWSGTYASVGLAYCFYAKLKLPQ